jgi:hypothetical protein
MIDGYNVLICAIVYLIVGCLLGIKWPGFRVSGWITYGFAIAGVFEVIHFVVMVFACDNLSRCAF